MLLQTRARRGSGESPDLHGAFRKGWLCLRQARDSTCDLAEAIPLKKPGIKCQSPARPLPSPAHSATRCPHPRSSVPRSLLLLSRGLFPAPGLCTAVPPSRNALPCSPQGPSFASSGPAPTHRVPSLPARLKRHVLQPPVAWLACLLVSLCPAKTGTTFASFTVLPPRPRRVDT